jgi:hypothetical protein
MTIGEFKQWLIDNEVPDHAVILMAPAGEAYFAFEPEYDGDEETGEAVIISFCLGTRFLPGCRDSAK